MRYFQVLMLGPSQSPYEGACTLEALKWRTRVHRECVWR